MADEACPYLGGGLKSISGCETPAKQKTLASTGRESSKPPEFPASAQGRGRMCDTQYSLNRSHPLSRSSERNPSMSITSLNMRPQEPELNDHGDKKLPFNLAIPLVK